MNKTGAALGHIWSLWLGAVLVKVTQSRVDADEVTGRHADATVSKFFF
ncbi:MULTISPECIES: hypothetical protein [Aeromonas]|nr:hypothetical protein [Aeromonas caviae]MBL0556292.1 hypothetical protein [Aeromonas caviae]